MAIRLTRTDSEHRSDDCMSCQHAAERKRIRSNIEVKDLSELDQPNGLLVTSELPAMPRSASGRRIVVAEL